MDNLFSVKDKTILITGGAGGIGSALVQGFMDAGAKVGSVDRKEDNPIDCWYTAADLSHFENIGLVFDRFIKEFGYIDVLINAAAITCPFDGMNYPMDLWHKTMKIDLNAVFALCKLTGLKMIDQKTSGSIINFTSINASQAMPNNPSYAAAKAGVRQLTKSFAYDWGKHNIRVNNIGPGYTKTPMNKISLSDPEKYKIRSDNSMLGRWANPEEMIGPAMFLASDASSFVTGTDLWVDGGWLSKGM